MNTLLNNAVVEVDEADLLAQVQMGDQCACECLVRQYAGQLLAVANRYVENEHDAADAVQDAFLSAFRSIDSFEGHCRIGTWLHRIVVNASLAKLRSRRRRPTVPIEDLLPTFDATGHHARRVSPWAATAADIVERAELRQLVRSCIDQLPDAYGTILIMRDIDGLDTDEAARQLGLSVGAVKTKLHRARQALRTLLARHLEHQDFEA
jgi:RNA polymerase sigma-70 factor, ECF subfamily